MTGVARLDPGKWLDSVTESLRQIKTLRYFHDPKSISSWNEYDGLVPRRPSKCPSVLKRSLQCKKSSSGRLRLDSRP
jgi:hypothetical protein